ncbi:hypothetical protein CBM2623_B170065 [Cupriavidus taiwanensis]|nr:hypothetical protein CBM2608_B140137 [Cupriavidus taiwanensis]SPA32871.1 hypothetical protein CBM2623_B170065 [Cupriavidus taiwanensis]SPA48350.1 hypothetical protein CBM2629_B10019 [Cupriavidus taiwanensis]
MERSQAQTKTSRSNSTRSSFLAHFRHYVARYSLMERVGDAVNAPLAALRTPTA